jgi:hypothetical protein
MPVVHQPGFNFGEIAPRTRGLTTAEAYALGCRKLENFHISPTGSAMKRRGSDHCGEAATSSQLTILIPYTIPGIAFYQIELGNEYIRFWKDGVQILSGGNPYQIASPYETADLRLLQIVQDPATLDIHIVLGRRYPRTLHRVSDSSWTLEPMAFTRIGPTYDSRKAQNTITLQVDTAGADLIRMLNASDSYFTKSDKYSLFLVRGGWVFTLGYPVTGVSILVRELTLPPADVNPDSEWVGPFRPGGLTGVNITTTAGIAGDEVDLSTTVDLFDPADVGQVFDVDAGNGIGHLRFIEITEVTDAKNAKGVVLYFAVTAATYNDSQRFTFTPSTNDINTILMTPDGTSGTITVATSDDVFEAAMEPGVDPGARFLLNGGVIQVVTVGSATQATCTVVKTLSGDWSSVTWEEEINASKGYPAVIFYYQGRLGMAGTQYRRSTAWFSKSNRPLDFTTGAFDNDAIHIVMREGSNLGDIRWAAPNRQLLLGALGGEIAVSGDPLTPSKVGVQSQSSLGGAPIAPVNVGMASLFVQFDRRSIQETAFQLVSDKFVATDLSAAAWHLFKDGKVVDIKFARRPYPLLFAVMEDGTLLVMSYDRQNKILAWHPWIISGGGTVDSVCIGASTGGDDVYLVVNRDNRKDILRYAAGRFTDAALTSTDVDGPLTVTANAISGLSHLEGRQVQLRLRRPDGSAQVYIGNFVVAGGQLDISALGLAAAPTEVEVGLGISAKAWLNPPEYADIYGSVWGRQKTVHGVALYLVDSRGGSLNGIPIKDRKSNDPLDDAPPHKTGYHVQEGEGLASNEDDPVVKIEHEEAERFEMAGISIKTTAGDSFASAV